MVAPRLDVSTSEDLAIRSRAHALRMVHRAKASHIGSALSVLDILAVLYHDILRVDPLDPKWTQRDRLILSKGHAAVALYAVLAETGFFPIAELDTYGEQGSRLLGHASHFVPGVELSTGSLGHGLPVACGLALAHKSTAPKVYCVLSDGELDEGSNWEAFLFAGHHRLQNLTAIIDYNRIQSFGRVEDVLSLGALDQKLESFGWAVETVDGHDHVALLNALSPRCEQPRAIIAETVKGKGVDFMENNLLWHYRSPNDEELAAALEGL